MNHEEAIRNQVAASYLLGDLTEAERDAFEEHYFDCVVCGDTVRNGAKMFAAGAQVVTQEPAYQRFRPWKWVASSAAAAALTVAVGYQTVVMPRLASTLPALSATPAPISLPSGANRGENDVAEVIRIPANRQSILEPELTAAELAHPRYVAEIRTAAGELVGDEQAIPDAMIRDARSGDHAVSLTVRPLPAGRYVLSIIGVPAKGGNRTVVHRWSVVVE